MFFRFLIVKFIILWYNKRCKKLCGSYTQRENRKGEKHNKMSKKPKKEKTKISIVSNETKSFIGYLEALLEEYGFNVKLLKRKAKVFAFLSILLFVIYKVVIEHYELFAFSRLVRLGVYAVSFIIAVYWLTFILYPLKIIIQNALAYWAFVIGYKDKKNYEQRVMFLCKHIPTIAKSMVFMESMLIPFFYVCKFENTHYLSNLSEHAIIFIFYAVYWGVMIFYNFDREIFKGWILDQNQCHKSVHKLWKDWDKKKNLKLIFYYLIPLEIVIVLSLLAMSVFI